MKKQTGLDHRDEKIAKEFLKLMPKFPKTFSRVLKKAERFDYRSPTTFISEIKAEVANCAPALIWGNSYQSLEEDQTGDVDFRTAVDWFTVN